MAEDERMKTVILTRKDIENVLTPNVANKTVEKAFKAYGLQQVDMPAKSYLYFKEGDLRSMPAYLHTRETDIAGIKSVTVHPGNADHDLPTVIAVIILIDPQNGFPLAILDGTYLTAIRTGAAGAVAAKFLSRKASKIAGFVGCGTQARSQLMCTLLFRKLKTVKVWEMSPGDACASGFKDWVEKTYRIKTMTSPDIDEVTSGVDILITTTPSRKPLVYKVSPGTHINAIGADAKGKQELDPKILKKAKLVIDDWAQTSHSGEINVPVRKKTLSQRDIYASLGDIAAGKKKGRTSDEEITVFDSTGLAIQDISCAYTVYEALKDKPGIKKIKLF
jgi:alanine dehydrogenase